MTNEYDAMRQLADSKAKAHQDLIKEKNIRYDFELSESRNRINEAFWHKVWITADSLFVLIIIYTIFHFA